MLRIERFIEAVAQHIDDSCATVSKPVLEQRLRACETCGHRWGLICRHPDCGCLIAIKARWRSERCPATPARWP